MFDEEGKSAAGKEAKHNFEAGERLSERKKAKHKNTKPQKHKKQALQQSDAESRTITEHFRQAGLSLTRQKAQQTKESFSQADKPSVQIRFSEAHDSSLTLLHASDWLMWSTVHRLQRETLASFLI